METAGNVQTEKRMERASKVHERWLSSKQHTTFDLVIASCYKILALNQTFRKCEQCNENTQDIIEFTTRAIILLIGSSRISKISGWLFNLLMKQIQHHHNFGKLVHNMLGKMFLSMYMLQPISFLSL